MRVLISNDDGYQAPGIQALVRAFRRNHDVLVVAPDGNRSAASSAITTRSAIRLTHQKDGVMALSGTPADCVQVGLYATDFNPDIVVSGINHGVNLGDDTLYSGTVAAALEGRFLSYPGIAVSQVGRQPQHLDVAAQMAVRFVEELPTWLAAEPRAGDIAVFSLNVPDAAEVNGFKRTRLGGRLPPRDVIRRETPEGVTFHLADVGQAVVEHDTDFAAVEAGFCAVTPLTSNMGALFEHERGARDMPEMNT